MGDFVTVTCSSYEGFPHPSEITLVNATGVMSVQNGRDYVLPILSLEDGGEFSCVLDDVTTQPSMSARLNVYSKYYLYMYNYTYCAYDYAAFMISLGRPQVVNVTNATVVRGSGGTTTIACNVHSSHCQTAVKFFKNGVEIQEDEQKYTTVLHVPKANQTFGNYLIVDNVADEDEGCYLCRVYANYSQLVPVAEHEVFILPPGMLNTTLSSPIQSAESIEA